MDNSFRKMQFSGIYEIRNLENNKRYIGSSNNIHRRWLGHRWDLENNRHHSKHLQKAWDKYGSDVFQLFVLEAVLVEELEERERYFVELYDSTNGDFGYNETFGGKGCPGRKISQDTRDKISKSNKGRTLSDISKQRISEAGIGRKHTQETKEKMSKSRKGVPQWWNIKGGEHNYTQEYRDKISKLHKGKKRSKEVGDRISESKLGRKRNQKTSSIYVGVSLEKRSNKWKAGISVNKKRIHLGSFETEVAAAIAYNESAIKYYGKNAKLNIIKED